MANTISKSEYARQRDNYLRSIRRYRARLSKEGASFDFSKYIPTIPKTLDKTPEEVKDEFDVLRQELAIKVGTKGKVKEAVDARNKRLKERETQKGAKFAQASKKAKDLKAETSKNRQQVKSAPKMSDAVLQTFEREFTYAETYETNKAGANKYRDAVKRAGEELNNKLSLEINRITNKYMPDLTMPEVRVAVSERLNRNFEDLWNAIEIYLFDFISDNQGNLDHTTAAMSAYVQFTEAVADTKISVEDKKRLSEALNNSVTGSVVTNVDKTEI